MNETTETVELPDGTSVFVHRWIPDTEPRAVVQILHGLGEHSARYQRLANHLTGAGFVVEAHDHRGHGRTADRGPDEAFFGECDGWRAVVDDAAYLTRRLREDFPDRPLILLGHSMGSSVALCHAFWHAGLIDGLALSGPVGVVGPKLLFGRAVSFLERLRLGQRGRSKVLDALSFGDFNKPFEPARTPFDWLSRDPIEVDKYVADPDCGWVASAQLHRDHLQGLTALAAVDNLTQIPHALPVYVFAGDMDPVGGFTKQVDALLGAMRDAGLSRLSHKYYPGGRHELFNDTNRSEVTSDVIEWLDGVVGC